MRSLPRIVSQIPADLRNFLDRVREYMGSGGEDRFVTLRELKSGGIVGTTPNGTITEPTTNGVETPNLPKGLTATGAFATVILEWSAPDYLGHAYTEVWAAPVDDFSLKELVGSTDGNIFSHNLGTGATRYYWIRFVNKLDTAGPYNATAGTMGQTSQDPDYLIDVLSDQYGVTGPAPFFQVDSPTVINGVTIPAGTYIKQAWIADATISRAKIQNLAVDNAKISDLSAAKITAGTLQVGSYIQSQSYVSGSTGWKINSDGAAEFAQAVVRGSLYGGSATSYSSGTGLFAGTDSSVYKFRVGNPSGNRLQWDGSSLSVNGTLLGGAATAFGSGLGLFAGTELGTYKWRVGNPTGARIEWDGAGVYVYNGAGNVTIASGDLDYSKITGTKPPANADKTADNYALGISGQGNFATLNQIPASTATTYIADYAVSTRLIAVNAVSQAFIGLLPTEYSVFNIAGTDVALPSFTVPYAGKLITQVVTVVHNFSDNFSRDVQLIHFVNGGSQQRNFPILRANQSGANSAFIPLSPLGNTKGNSISYSTIHEDDVYEGQTITVEINAVPNDNNTAVYIVDAYYTATLYKR